MTTKQNGPLHLERLPEEVIEITVDGVTPVIPHRWSEKSLRLMRDKQTEPTRKAKVREAKVPEQEAYDSCYWLKTETSEGIRETGALPAPAFKAAMVGGARFFDNITMTELKSFLYVEGEGPDQLIPITGDWVMREDTPRNATGVADLRYRMMFGLPWSAILRVHYVPWRMDAETILALVDAGGRGGVGDWRPNSPKSQTGSYGQFRVRDI